MKHPINFSPGIVVRAVAIPVHEGVGISARGAAFPNAAEIQL
jgi:hypothetical protein